jgi:hypothetical protein
MARALAVLAWSAVRSVTGDSRTLADFHPDTARLPERWPSRSAARTQLLDIGCEARISPFYARR